MRPAFPIITLFPGSPASAIAARLKGNGIRFQNLGGEFPALDARSASQLFLVPIGALSQGDWPQLRARIWRANRLFIAAGARLTTAQIVNATRDGAYDVLDMRDDDERWDEALEKAEASQKLWLKLYGASANFSSGRVLVGDSPAMQSLRQSVERIGPTGATVLILGDSGSGKERVAQALHEAGGGGPFVAVNCAAIPKDLLESELFGAEKGAFSGSIKEKPGLVEQATKGTLFLDELGEMDLALQPKLLRFLETRKARRVGGTKEYAVTVRVVSATNRNLEEEIARGGFRSDLFYRLSEVTLRLPPLRQRREDIPALTHIFLEQACERFGKNFDYIEPELIAEFQMHDWPGNARELKSTVDRMVILFDGPVLRAQWWDRPVAPMQAVTEVAQGSSAPLFPHVAAPLRTSTSPAPHRKQKMELARELLTESDNNYTWVSAQLGVNVTTLYRWRKAGKVG
jgi:DNA-binding NtrC family response regulator